LADPLLDRRRGLKRKLLADDRIGERMERFELAHGERAMAMLGDQLFHDRIGPRQITLGLADQFIDRCDV
jgi:hypothetical protein